MGQLAVLVLQRGNVQLLPEQGAVLPVVPQNRGCCFAVSYGVAEFLELRLIAVAVL